MSASYSCDTLRELGYSVLEAETGRSGLQILEAHPEICVLFTDVGLPGGMNGRQLVEQARKTRPDLKVLFTTGYARNAIVHEGRLDPGVELITKPFSQSALAGKLRDILDSARTPGRILLVEDEALIQMLATDYLEGAGYTVDAAGSATEAMNKLALVHGGVDAAVIDIGLPDRRGDALFREIRALYSSLPIVLATGQNIADLRAAFHGEHRSPLLRNPTRITSCWRHSGAWASPAISPEALPCKASAPIATGAPCSNATSQQGPPATSRIRSRRRAGPPCSDASVCCHSHQASWAPMIGGPPRSVHMTATSSSLALQDTSKVPLAAERAPYFAEFVASS